MSAEEDMLLGAGRLVDSVQNEFKNVFEKRPVLQELSGSTSATVMLREPVEQAVTTAVVTACSTGSLSMTVALVLPLSS